MEEIKFWWKNKIVARFRSFRARKLSFWSFKFFNDIRILRDNGTTDKHAHHHQHLRCKQRHDHSWWTERWPWSYTIIENLYENDENDGQNRENLHEFSILLTKISNLIFYVFIIFWNQIKSNFGFFSNGVLDGTEGSNHRLHLEVLEKLEKT